MVVDRGIKGALLIAEVNDMAFSETDAKWFGHLISRIGMIFQRQQYLKELSRERDRLTAIMNHLQQGVQILDRDYHILFQNRWSKEKLNIHPEQDKCYTRFFGFDAPCPQCPLLRRKSIRKPKSIEIQDQRGKIYQIILSEFKDRTGQAQILEIVRDITQEKRQDAEKIRIEQLETAMAMAGSIAHELNQPLTGITGLTSLVLEDLAPEDDFSYESLKEIETQANRMRELIRRFQNIAKIEKMNYPGKEILDLRRSTE
ncbi:MAG: histidine kinase dimerization/phospho-acceptor domain-containing protein [candidate division KSB1 bacterium]|nr:histidine kinase dimerization/phospho-acceptor domain-containing protein [candidate division KSB1 bacterium]